MPKTKQEKEETEIHTIKNKEKAVYFNDPAHCNKLLNKNEKREKTGGKRERLRL